MLLQLSKSCQIAAASSSVFFPGFFQSYRQIVGYGIIKQIESAVCLRLGRWIIEISESEMQLSIADGHSKSFDIDVRKRVHTYRRSAVRFFAF